jgi:glycosyltransferase involved in cell wall biosynthesis
VRIVQLHDESWDSGLAHYALTLSSELARRGHEVRFWAAAGSYAAGQARFLGLKTREIANPWLMLPLLRVELAKDRVELINAHTGSAHSLAAALAAGGGVKVVRTRGDARPPKGTALTAALARRTDLFIAANEAIGRRLRAIFPKTRVAAVPQGLAVPPAAALGEEPVVGILGRLDPVKGHEDLIAAARLLAEDHPGARFQAAGDGVLREPLEQAASSLDGRFKLLGFVPDALKYIAGCRIGVVASRGSEAVSRAALEWMSLGRPVVATRVGCLPELVEDGATGLLVPPGEPKALAAALDSLLEDPDYAARLGEAGRRRFERLYTVAGFAEKTERAYAEALGR